MHLFDLLYCLALFTAVLLTAMPLGNFMARLYSGERTFLSPLLAPAERFFYRVCGVDPAAEMGWRRYAAALLLCNLVLFLTLFGMLLAQVFLPMNPRGLPGLAWPLALNTAVSFVTNTNWQNYSGETTMSLWSQMAGLTVHNFVSAASGIAVAIALIRGVARRTTATIGNFWVDLTRTILYVLLPVALIAALLLVSQGVVQNFTATRTVPLLQPFSHDRVTVQEVTIPMGPVASQEAIKELGTNGGGFFNANASHPFENPTPFSNFLEVLLILLIPTALTRTFGLMAGNPRQGWALFGVMCCLFVAAVGVLHWQETAGNPLLAGLGVEGANLEGKELRFGLAGSNLFEVATTATSCGAVTAMHDSLTPLGGLVPLSLILLGEIVFGGVGSGLYTMLAFAIIAVFVSGLMIGRTPEYLGKKIEVREMWMSIVIVLTAGVVILTLSGVAVLIPAATASLGNQGAHGLSEILYAFSSMANNNGSAFAGLAGDTGFYNLLGALAMVLGRYVPAVAALALAGGLAEKKYVPPSLGTLPTDQLPFAFWLTLVILIIGALTFFPALALGPIAEHLVMRGGN